jgi:hypothetical protein
MSGGALLGRLAPDSATRRAAQRGAAPRLPQRVRTVGRDIRGMLQSLGSSTLAHPLLVAVLGLAFRLLSALVGAEPVAWASSAAPAPVMGAWTGAGSAAARPDPRPLTEMSGPDAWVWGILIAFIVIGGAVLIGFRLKQTDREMKLHVLEAERRSLEQRLRAAIEEAPLASNAPLGPMSARCRLILGWRCCQESSKA